MNGVFKKIEVDRKDFKLFSDQLLLNWVRFNELASGYQLVDVIADYSVRLVQNDFDGSANKAIIYRDTGLLNSLEKQNLRTRAVLFRVNVSYLIE